MSPYLTHPLTALMRFSILYAILATVGAPVPHWIAFAYVAGYFEGREAGQLEHDLKNAWTSPTHKAESKLAAWFGAALYLMWPLANFAQAIAGIVPALIAAGIISFFGGK